MLMFYDYHCTQCGATFEELLPTDQLGIACECGATAKRILSPVRIDRMRIACSGSSASPESIAHFDRVHRQRKTIEERAFKEHGDYGKAAGSD